MIFFLLLILGCDAFIPMSITIGRGTFLNRLLGLEPKGRDPAGSTIPKTTAGPRVEEKKEAVIEGNNGTTLIPTTEEVEEDATTTREEEEEEELEVEVNTQPVTTEEEELEKENREKVEATTTFDLFGSLETTTEETALLNNTKCQDQFSRCYGVSHLCKNKFYEKIMITSCAKTCGYCKEFVRLPMAERCRDTYPDQCAIWGAHGFCHAYFYTMPEKVESCMKTCNLC